MLVCGSAHRYVCIHASSDVAKQAMALLDSAGDRPDRKMTPFCLTSTRRPHKQEYPAPPSYNPVTNSEQYSSIHKSQPQKLASHPLS